MSEAVSHNDTDEGRNDDIDEALVPVREYLRMLLPELEPVIDESGKMQMSIAQLELSMPIEIDILHNEAEVGDVQIGMSPPLYYVETSYEIVSHQIHLTIVEDDTLIDA